MKLMGVEEASEDVATPLGVVSIRVRGGSGVVITAAPVLTPRLPDGMAVDGVKLIRVHVVGAVMPDEPLELHVLANIKGGPESGEHLDSVAYYQAIGSLHVGVRDKDWLATAGIIAEEVVYEPNGLRQTVQGAPPKSLLNVSVAWRVKEHDLLVDDLSTWFAADLALPW